VTWNAYAIVILVALVAGNLLDLVGDLLNLRSLDPELPEEFCGDGNEDAYARSQSYTRVRTRFGIVHTAFDLAVLLSLWFTGGFGWLSDWARGLGFGAVSTGLLFIGTLALGSRLLALPFQLYSVFVIEERFGFNRTSHATFWTDQLKGVVLTLLLGGALLAAVLAFLESSGPLAWLWCWAATTAFMLLALVIGPTWIMPLFNKFQPLEEGELRESLLAYARSTDFPLEDVYVMDGSKRSSKANAFFTGFGGNKRVALFDTLIAAQTTGELVAVVAHEIGHYKRRHILQRAFVGIAHLGLLFWILSLFLDRPGLFAAFGVSEGSVGVGLVFFMILYSPVELLLSLFGNALSRRNEYQADEFAARTTGGSQELISALKKLSAENLSNLTPHPLYVLLHHSHPPLQHRIAALRAVAPCAPESPIHEHA
jgi:STE24 endopeptidase